jgi:hypothetical protein
MDSILTSVKKDIGGITEACNHFDDTIIRHINSAFVILWQAGVGPSKCYSIEDESNTWDEFTNGDETLEAVKTYVGQKVHLLFDPPTNSTLLQALKESVSEFEWRLNFFAEIPTKEE